MRSRCMSLLPRTTLHSDSEQYLLHSIYIFVLNTSFFLLLDYLIALDNLHLSLFYKIYMYIV
jgi:hypothetical protein